MRRRYFGRRRLPNSARYCQTRLHRIHRTLLLSPVCAPYKGHSASPQIQSRAELLSDRSLHARLTRGAASAVALSRCRVAQPSDFLPDSQPPHLHWAPTSTTSSPRSHFLPQKPQARTSALDSSRLFVCKLFYLLHLPSCRRPPARRLTRPTTVTNSRPYSPRLRVRVRRRPNNLLPVRPHRYRLAIHYVEPNVSPSGSLQRP